MMWKFFNSFRLIWSCFPCVFVVCVFVCVYVCVCVVCMHACECMCVCVVCVYTCVCVCVYVFVLASHLKNLDVSVAAADDGGTLPTYGSRLAGEAHHPELHTVRHGHLALGTDCP